MPKLTAEIVKNLTTGNKDQEQQRNDPVKGYTEKCGHSHPHNKPLIVYENRLISSGIT